MARRVSLLGRFSGLSLVAMVALGLTIGLVLQARIESRALRHAEQLTRVFTSVAVAPQLSSSDLDKPIEPTTLLALDDALEEVGDADVRVMHANLFAADGTIFYSDRRTRIGEVEKNDDVDRAHSGALISEIERETGDRGEEVSSSLEVYVPVRLP